MNSLLIVLTLIGLTLSLYFTLLFFHVVDANARCIPRFCRPAMGDCATIVHHPDASIFFFPNSILGIFYYTAVFVAIKRNFVSALPMVSVSWFAVAVSAYLTYSLLGKVRALCVLCIAAHVINLFIAFGVTFL